MQKLFKIIGACLLILFVILYSLYALNSTLKADDTDWSNVELSYYEDASDQLTVSKINTVFAHGDFTEKKTPYFNFGRSRSTYWIRIFATDAADLKNYIAVYCPNVQDVRIYLPTEEGYETYVSGWGNSAAREDEGLTYPVFRLNQKRGAGQAVYLRIQSVYTHLYTIDLYNEPELQHAKVINYCMNSFLFGILLTIVIINLIIYFALKSKICLLFALCVLLISVHQGCTTGIYNVLLTKHSDLIMGKSIEIGMLYLISIIVFFMVFSEVKIYHRVYYLCCKILIAACLLCYPICFIDIIAANFYAHVLSVVPALFILYASLRLYFAGKIKHRLFLIGWNLTTIIYIIVTLCTEGILHMHNNYISIHGVLVGIVIASILFTVAMVNYTKTIQLEHLKMQQQVQLVSEQVKRTEMALMQTQIKPHFLYNTLTAIEQLCEIDSRKAQSAITDFSSYLRSNIDFSAETKLIFIEQELENVRHYLSLEQMRFEERLNVTYDIQASGFMVPPLVVQPMVENAVRHGVTKKPEGGTVEISVEEDENAYRIAVMDNGVGFEPENIHQNGGNHIGINNAKDRLTRMCRGTLEINSQIGVGTTVIIFIPKENEYELDRS